MDEALRKKNVKFILKRLKKGVFITYYSSSVVTGTGRYSQFTYSHPV